MKRVLFIGYVWPEPSTTAAGNRMLQLVNAFLKKGYDITFASTASKSEYSHDLKVLGVKEVSIRLNDSSFDQIAVELNPQIVVFDRFMVEEQFGWRIAENCPNTLRILNTEDLHSLREYREKAVQKHLEYSTQDWLKQDKTKREIASIFRSDLTLLVSFFEQKLLLETIKINDSLLMHLPFMLSLITEEEVSKWPSFEDRQDFISFGNGRHAPNVDSFKYLKDSIWPLVRKELPTAKLHIYGAYLPQQIIEMHRPKEGLLVHGWVEDLKTVVQKAKVVLAPLRFGAGIKGKLALAMQNGTPNVTTPIGAEGMGVENEWPGFIADDPEVFAKKAVALYHDNTVWSEAQKKGVDIINSNYNFDQLNETLILRIGELLENLDSHRNQNVIGSILQHQSVSASKYMGKWIEEKNKFKK